MTAALLIALVATSMANGQATSEDGNGYPNPKTGGLLFMTSPCPSQWTRPKVSIGSQGSWLRRDSRSSKDPSRPRTEFGRGVNSNSFRDENLAVEKVVAVLDGRPVFPLKIDLTRNVDQNSFGATRTTHDATAEFPTSLFEPRSRPLIIALVTSGGRVEFEILPADLQVLNSQR